MKLKPCPFCGNETKMTYGEVFCPNKNCIIGTITFIKSKWNTRPAEQELLEALKWFLEPDHPIGSHAEHVYIFREKAKQLIEKYEVIK